MTPLEERTDIGCVLLTAAVDGIAIVEPAAKVSGVELPVTPGAVKAAVGRTAMWLSPRSWLIHCGVEEEMALVRGLNEAFPDKLAHAVPFTDQLCWFDLSGTVALDLLTEGGFVSLERDGLAVGHAKRTLIAQISVVIVRRGETEWLVAVERSRARYFAEWVGAAAA